jgi:hypothetical protein
MGQYAGLDQQSKGNFAVDQPLTDALMTAMAMPTINSTADAAAVDGKGLHAAVVHHMQVRQLVEVARPEARPAWGVGMDQEEVPEVGHHIGQEGQHHIEGEVGQEGVLGQIPGQRGAGKGEVQHRVGADLRMPAAQHLVGQWGCHNGLLTSITKTAHAAA